MMLDPTENYTRKNQILYDSLGRKVLKFKESTPDRNDLTGELIENINMFIKCYPERVEFIETKQEANIQLDLF